MKEGEQSLPLCGKVDLDTLMLMRQLPLHVYENGRGEENLEMVILEEVIHIEKILTQWKAGHRREG